MFKVALKINKLEGSILLQKMRVEIVVSLLAVGLEGPIQDTLLRSPVNNPVWPFTLKTSWGCANENLLGQYFDS